MVKLRPRIWYFEYIINYILKNLNHTYIHKLRLNMLLVFGVNG